MDLVTSSRLLSEIREIERRTLAEVEQVNLPITHGFGAGCYSRTVKLKKWQYITGAPIKIPTQVFVVGKCITNMGDEYVILDGCATLLGAAGRQQLFWALEDTCIIMVFATEVTTVPEAEAEFTDEADRLNSRMPGATNEVFKCQE